MLPRFTMKMQKKMLIILKWNSQELRICLLA